MTKIGENIRTARKKAGLTQKALGEKCNMPDSQIRQYELGMVNPKLEQVRRIADALNVPLHDLMPSLKPDDSVGEIDLFAGLEPLNQGFKKAQKEYYQNKETAEMAQKIFENKELRLLFDAAQDADPEDLQMVHSMLLALKRKERGQQDESC